MKDLSKNSSDYSEKGRKLILGFQIAEALLIVFVIVRCFVSRNLSAFFWVPALIVVSYLLNLLVVKIFLNGAKEALYPGYRPTGGAEAAIQLQGMQDLKKRSYESFSFRMGDGVVYYNDISFFNERRSIKYNKMRYEYEYRVYDVENFYGLVLNKPVRLRLPHEVYVSLGLSAPDGNRSVSHCDCLPDNYLEDFPMEVSNMSVFDDWKISGLKEFLDGIKGMKGQLRISNKGITLVIKADNRNNFLKRYYHARFIKKQLENYDILYMAVNLLSLINVEESKTAVEEKKVPVNHLELGWVKSASPWNRN